MTRSVTYNISASKFLQTIFFYPHYVEIFGPNAISALLIGQCPGRAGVHLSANVAPVMIVMFH